MELLLNDLSLHEQFPDVAVFREAMQCVMLLRQTAANFGRDLHAHRSILNSRINATTSLHEALQALPQSEKRSILQWLTRQGPFWEDAAEYDPDVWMWWADNIVTDTAVGEAAYCATVGVDRRLVSFTPSDWTFSPATVQIGPDAATEVMILNYWQMPQLNNALQAAEPPIASWARLDAVCRAKLRRLTFATDCFGYLNGQPFAPGAAARILIRLNVLDQLLGAVDPAGQRTAEGNRIYRNHFTGDKAWFSDSSDSEKDEFRNELTFPHPEIAGRSLLCTWHGKVNHPPFRFHFAWPERPGAPLYVVYAGLKITRR